MPDLNEASVEQRCARIRGRMVWILSQLEGDGGALTDRLVLASASAPPAEEGPAPAGVRTAVPKCWLINPTCPRLYRNTDRLPCRLCRAPNKCNTLVKSMYFHT